MNGYYETGEVDMPVVIVRRLADHYGVSAEHLLGWSNERKAAA